jgi:hypothetical protein
MFCPHIVMRFMWVSKLSVYLRGRNWTFKSYSGETPALEDYRFLNVVLLQEAK